MISLGDTIICINNTRLAPDLLSCPLQLNQEYEVMAMKKCRCGHIYIDIGLSISSNKYDVVCDACQRRFNDGIWWFDIKRFIKKPEAKAQMTMELLLHSLN